MSNFFRFDQLRPQQLERVGLKALYLGQLVQAGCSVVPGVVVSTQVFKEFLQQISWSLPLFADLPAAALRLDIDNPQQLQAIAQELQRGIAEATLPGAVAEELAAAIAPFATNTLILRPSVFLESGSAAEVVLRSSGLCPTRVVPGNMPAVVQGVKQVWASLFSAKSLFYWQRLGISLHQVRLAVLVQPIQSAIAAGTLRLAESQLELEATVGLGTAIAWGEVMPDVYQLHPDSGQVQAKRLGQRSVGYKVTSEGLTLYWLTDAQRHQYCLTDAVLPQFAQLMQTAIAAVGKPVELEWVLQSAAAPQGQLLVTQVIPQGLMPAGSSVDLPRLALPTRKKHELFPGARLIATGLAASTGQAIARATVIADVSLPPEAIPPHTVLAAPMIPLNWLPIVRQAAAIVSEQGSMTSHSAIVARDLGVPAVMGVEGILQQVQSGELIWVDGDRGRVYRLDKAETTVMPFLPSMPPAPSQPASSGVKRHPIQTQLFVNLNQVEQLSQIAALPVDGVGLLRAELLALAAFAGQHPQQWLQQDGEVWVNQMAAAIAPFAIALYPRPVFYRSFDLRIHEFAPSKLATLHAAKPSALGVRGTFQYQVDDTLFGLELRALLAVQQLGGTNVRLLLPFVRTVEEFEFCRQRVQQMGLPQTADFQLWIMAEVPSVLWLLPEFVQAGVQGISIGTNDLTQLILGVDRDDPLMASVFEERHPAVKQAIAQLITTARSLGIPCSICGEAPVRYPELIVELIRWGIHAISVAPEAVETTYQAIVEAEASR